MHTHPDKGASRMYPGMVIFSFRWMRGSMKERIYDSASQNLVDNINSGVAVYEVRNDGSSGSDYILLDFNRAALKIEGKSREEVVGKSLLELRPNINEFGLIPILRQVWKTGKPGFLSARKYQGSKFSNWYENRVFRLSRDRVVAVFDDVTGQKLARNALADSESLLREVLNGMDKAIAIYEPVDGGDDFRFIFLNKFGERLTHFKAEEVIGERLSVLFPGESSIGLIASLKEALLTGRVVTIPLKEYRNDRIAVWVENTLIKLPSGNVVAIFEDSHERKEAENALKRNEARYRLAEKIGKVGNWEYNPETQMFWRSEGARRIHGFGGDKESFTTEEVLSRIPERDRVYAALVALIEKAEPYDLEFDIIPRDSTTPRTITSIARLIQESPGSPLKVSGVIQDITERKRTEQALRASERQYSSLFNSIRDAVLVTDDRRVMVNCNEAFTELFGYTKDEILGKGTVFLYADSSEHGTIGDLLDQHNDECHDFLINIQYRKKDGSTFPGETTIYSLHTGGTECTGNMGLIRDVSQREILIAQIRQSQKMEAIGQLAGGIAHDFNNILTIINGYSEILLSRCTLPDTEVGEVAQIHRAGKRASELTAQLLAFSRKQILETETVDINLLITNLSRMLVRIIGEDINLTSRLKAHPSLISVDPGQFEQIIMNLAVNSRDAMPTGGELLIETRNTGTGEAHSGMDSDPSGREAILMTISDNGHGMDAQTRKRIFEPFFTTKDPGRGTGMGLSTVYGIVKQSGGEIEVSSTPDKGTEFRIYFPAVDPSAPGSREHRAERRNLFGRETILVVEDEQSVLELIKLVLIRYGYDPVGVHGAMEAMDTLRTLDRPVHMLLTDVVMPGMSGNELVDMVKVDHPEIQICFMSGHTDDAILLHGVSENALNYMQKPFSPIELVNKIRSILDGN